MSFEGGGLPSPNDPGGASSARKEMGERVRESERERDRERERAFAGPASLSLPALLYLMTNPASSTTQG